ncbi:MAG TPA: hypothetical protein VMV10_10030 [Pirellulales bacterium]|nr:hypothetical protein [Pirellulales bacterium]
MRNSFTAAVVCLAICGCGKGGPGRPKLSDLPIKGVVTLDGKPLAGADVVFMGGEPPAVLAGKTKDDGSYQLQTAAGGEANVPGNCKVTISRLVKPDGSPLAADETPADAGAVEQLPGKYSRFDRTTLTATLTSAEATIDFPLTTQ